tara:strand:- start:33093 stop:33350 length:258 start_codon:yes stop_codon:yes gene_type:complete
MKATLNKITTSLILTPIDNINLRTKKIIDQELMEEIVVDRKSELTVFNLLTQQVTEVRNSKLNEQHHWYYLNDKLYKIIHIIQNN